MKSKLLAIAVIAATAGTVALFPTVQGHTVRPPIERWLPERPLLPINNQRPKIEVVFALDTTGSMGGLIQGAKDNIWSIANSLASAEGNPEIRMGLVAYRDRGDDYVTRVTELSSDLDQVYATLMDFEADGGGDGPESVNQALYDAVHSMSWSADPNAYRVIFLVGDAPGHQDYPNDIKFDVSLGDASAKGIVVNTIQCGSSPITRRQWEQVAQLGMGEYLQVGQGGGALAIATPFDARIANLAKELDDSRLFFGDAVAKAAAERKQQLADKLNTVASVAARAKRGLFNASAEGAANFAGDNELIEAISSGRVDLDEIDQAQLPTELQALAPAARERRVAAATSQRSELRRQISELETQRRDYVSKQLKSEADEKGSLDYQIYRTVAEQAAAKGLKYDAEPDY